MKSIRTFAILDYLKEKKYCSFAELMEYFSISQATAHRDIAELYSSGLIRKIKGGIASVRSADPSLSLPSPYYERIKYNQDAKKAIAQKAIQEIQDGDIIFLDSSTTTFYLAEELYHSNFANLTIITNSVLIMQNFHKYPKHYVLISLGGTYDLPLNSFLGNTALNTLNSIQISKAFVSAFGICDNEVSTNHEYHADFLRKLLKSVNEKFLLCDQSKFNRTGLFPIANKDLFKKIITDK